MIARHDRCRYVHVSRYIRIFTDQKNVQFSLAHLNKNRANRMRFCLLYKKERLGNASWHATALFEMPQKLAKVADLWMK